MEREIYKKRTLEGELIRDKDVKDLLEEFLYDNELTIKEVRKYIDMPFPALYYYLEDKLFLNPDILFKRETETIEAENLKILLIIYHEFKHIFQFKKINSLEHKILKMEREIIFSNEDFLLKYEKFLLREYNADFYGLTRIQRVFESYTEDPTIIKIFRNFLLNWYNGGSPISKLSSIADYSEISKLSESMSEYEKIENGFDVNFEKILEIRTGDISKVFRKY